MHQQHICTQSSVQWPTIDARTPNQQLMPEFQTSKLQNTTKSTRIARFGSTVDILLEGLGELGTQLSRSHEVVATVSASSQKAVCVNRPNDKQLLPVLLAVQIQVCSCTTTAANKLAGPRHGQVGGGMTLSTDARIATGRFLI